MNERGINYDDDDPFSDKRVRHAFVRKVLLIVGAQLAMTILIVLPFIFVKEVKIFSLRYKWVAYIFMGVTIVLVLVLGCFQNLRRRYPINVVLLIIFTVAEGIIVGFMCGAKYPMHVLLAFGITLVVCVTLIIFATQVKFDFTGFLPFIVIAGIILAVMGIVSIFFRNRIFIIVMSSLGVFVFSIYLIINIQMMIGGKHKYQFDPEDYVVAAINIYTDIITIFMYILSLVGLLSND